MITTTSLLLVIITLAATAYFVLFPVAKRSADDLAALVVLSAQTWVELPPEARPDLEIELLEHHSLRFTRDIFMLDEPPYFRPPYVYFLDEALKERLGEPFYLGGSQSHPGWHWIDIPMAGQQMRFGFTENRMGASPSKAIISITLSLVLLAVIAALLLSIRITRPLVNFSRAITTVGRGEKAKIQETGPQELKLLAENFNEMSKEVSQLLENRTVLLAGISHDLRTPITRMHLALEMIPDLKDSNLGRGIYANLKEMEVLLSDTMQIAKGINQEELCATCDLTELVSEVVEAHRHLDIDINWAPASEAEVSLPCASLKRVIANLLGNAIRYGDGHPVDIQLEVSRRPTIIIRDHGSGIPEDKVDMVFQPFFRLEGSRALTTGGSGLGLAIVRQICDANSWVVTLSPATGGGTTATLIL